MDLERVERQQLKEERDGIQAKLRDTEMMLERMKKEAEERVRQVCVVAPNMARVSRCIVLLPQKFQVDEKYEDERARDKEIVNAHAYVV